MDYTELRESDQDSIRELLLGRKVIEAGMQDESPGHGPLGWLLLDDGTRLEMFGNDGGCACTAGCYTLTGILDVAAADNIITDVVFEDDPAGDDQEGEGFYRIFIYADNALINLATFEGSDGNGYYGTGYHVRVRRP